jgi:U2 small nuclear ribonucleoprotein B''
LIGLELRHQLYQLFAPFGRVVDIVALKVRSSISPLPISHPLTARPYVLCRVSQTQKMRGQAFIVFKDQVAATTALRTLGGEVFYGKPLVRSRLPI